jgi:hypothetical protein
MERDTPATLHRRKLGRVDRMIASGPIEELIRQFRSLSESTKNEYFIMVDGKNYGPQEIKGLARELGI